MSNKKKQRYPQPLEMDDLTTPRGQQIKIRHQIKPKNATQQRYIESLRTFPLTISNGPAGGGKTFLATAVALEKLLDKEVDRIIISRPVVEADEKLGFLPGGLEEKLDPYLKPIYDAVQDLVGPTMAKRLLESGRLEIVPLAYMRGRTFNNAYVILDEAQNATEKQMRLFLTRLGEGTFACVNGDVTQSDLTRPRDHVGAWENGLEYAIRKLAGKADQIAYTCFFNQDVVRSALVQTIIDLLDAPDGRERAPDTIAGARE